MPSGKRSRSPSRERHGRRRRVSSRSLSRDRARHRRRSRSADRDRRRSPAGYRERSRERPGRYERGEPLSQEPPDVGSVHRATVQASLAFRCSLQLPMLKSLAWKG